MQEHYEKVELEVIVFVSEDVITDSQPGENETELGE